MATADQLLVQQTLAGDPDAFGTLVERYSGLVYSLVLEVVRRPEDVEDLVQEAFCRAYQQPSLRQPAKFAPWLAQLAHHTALGWLRREQARSRAEALSQPWTGPVPGAPPDRVLEVQERAAMLWEALDHLPAGHRRVVALYYLEGCTFRQIAQFLGLPLATVRWRLLRSERRLGQELGRLLGQEQRLRRRDRQELRDKVLSGLPLGLWPALGPRVIPWWSWAGLSQRLLPWAPAAVLVGLAGPGVLYVVGSGLVGRWLGGVGDGLSSGAEDRSGWTAPRRIRFQRPGSLPEQLELPRPAQDLNTLPEVQALLSAPVPGDSLGPPAVGTLSSPPVEQRLGARAAADLSRFPAPATVPARRAPPDQVAFVSVRLFGAGSHTGPGNALADLARHLRDQTPIAARLVEAASYTGFTSLDLLQYPIHFLLQGGGLPTLDQTPATHLSADEVRLLGRYLRQGGFLYVEGDRLFLSDMVQHLRQALAGQGKVSEVALSHPLYHAFQDFGDGFPGQGDPARYPLVPSPAWYYPTHRDGAAALSLGVWGIELGGEMAVLLNDGTLLRNWEPDLSADEAAALGRDVPIKEPKLMAASNIVVYALTRPHGAASSQAASAGP